MSNKKSMFLRKNGAKSTRQKLIYISVLAILALACLGLICNVVWRFNAPSNVNLANIKQAAARQIMQDCNKQLNKKQVKISCHHIDIDEPKLSDRVGIDPADYLVSGSVTNSTGDLVWSSIVAVTPSGHVEHSYVSHRDPKSGVYTSD